VISKLGCYIEIMEFGSDESDLVKAVIADIQLAAAQSLQFHRTQRVRSPELAAVEPKALTNGKASPRGRTAVCFRFEETMEALERTGGDVKAAASLLRITFERLRARLYTWTKKGLVEKVGVDQWRLA